MTNARRAAVRRGAATALALVALVAGPFPARRAEAQGGGAGAAALGMGDNYTAPARGRNAVAWNPANLAMPGNPGFSLSLAPVRVFAGISPVTAADLAERQGVLLPTATKEEWLRRIAEAGRQRGAFGADATALSLSIGRLGLQLSSTVTGVLDIGPDAAELLLFGNAGRTGDPRDFDLAGSAIDMAVTTTIALGYAQPLSLVIGALPGQSMAVGATFKYVIGNALVSGADDGSVASSDPLEIGLEFPIIHSDTAFGFDGGSGYGLDIGAAWKGGPLAVGVVVHDLLNTFEWDARKLRYRPGTAVFSADTTYSSFHAMSIDRAPEAVRARASRLIEDRRYPPTLAIGAALEALPKLTLTADVRRRLGEGLDIGPATHAGVGAEFRPLPFIPLRAGVAALSGGYLYAGGIGLELGIINLGVSAAQRRSDVGEHAMLMLSLSFGGN